MSDRIIDALAADTLQWESASEEYDGDKALLEINIARLCLARCKTVMEAKRIADAAEAARVYRERTNASADAVNAATEVKVLAEALMGEFLQQMPKQHGARGVGKGGVESTDPTLKDLGISKDASSRAQKIASLPKDELERRIEAGKTAGKLTIASVLNPPAQEVVYDASTDEEEVEVLVPEKPARKKRDNYKLSAGMWITETIFDQIKTIQEHDTEFVKAHEAIIAFCRERLSKHRAT